MGRLALLLVILASGPAFAESDAIFGRWVVEGKEAVFELEPCGDAACGRLVWLREPLNEDGTLKLDVKHPDPALRRRPICGIRLLTGLERADDGGWQNGRIYSTRDGRTYGIEVELDGPDKLRVRGYLGIRLLGQTQTWTRDRAGLGNCATMTGSDTEH